MQVIETQECDEASQDFVSGQSVFEAHSPAVQTELRQISPVVQSDLEVHVFGGAQVVTSMDALVTEARPGKSPAVALWVPLNIFGFTTLPLESALSPE